MVGSSLNVKPEVYYVPVLNDIFLALQVKESFFFYLAHAAALF